MITKDYKDMQPLERLDVAKALNPDRGKYNCQACAASFDIMCRTSILFSIRKDVDTRTMNETDVMKKLYKNFEKFDTFIALSSSSELSEELVKKFGNNDFARGRIMLKSASGGNGHMVSFYMENRIPRLVDSQTGLDFPADKADKYIGADKIDWNKVDYCRTDNLELAPGALEYLYEMSKK